jgi:Zn-dependent protease with chaperone function
MLRFLVMALMLAMFGATGCGDLQSSKAKTSWVEDNDLWREDNVNFASSNVNEATFNKIISIAEKLYAPVIKQWKEKLVIYRNWDDSEVNANAWRDGQGAAEINMYGGLARRPEVLPTGFALVLCHELGHLYGGKPYINEVKMAAESQADWYGASWCLKNITEQLQDPSALPTDKYIVKACASDKVCMQQLAGGLSLGRLLAVLSEENVPSFETPDTEYVDVTELSYAKTVQCRLDSYHNGTLGKERPRCWYKP